MKKSITLLILMCVAFIGTGFSQQIYWAGPVDLEDREITGTTTPGTVYGTLAYGDVDCTPNREQLLAGYSRLPADNYTTTEYITTDAVYDDRGSTAEITYSHAINVIPANSDQLNEPILVPAAPPGYILRIEYVPLD